MAQKTHQCHTKRPGLAPVLNLMVVRVPGRMRDTSTCAGHFSVGSKDVGQSMNNIGSMNWLSTATAGGPVSVNLLGSRASMEIAVLEIVWT